MCVATDTGTFYGGLMVVHWTGKTAASCEHNTQPASAVFQDVLRLLFELDELEKASMG